MNTRPPQPADSAPSVAADAGRDDRSLLAPLAAAFDRILACDSLADTLAALAALVEGGSRSGALAAIFLLDEHGHQLQLAAAPSLPAGHAASMECVAVGPCAGSSGTAVHRRASVHVADIEHDPLWADRRETVLRHGLRACWATPIFSGTGTVLGTLELYYRSVREPAAEDIECAAIATRTAAIAIERHRAQGALDDSERIFRLIENIPVAVYTCDAQGFIRLYNQAAVDLWGGAPRIGEDRWCGSWRLFNQQGVPLPHAASPLAAVMRGEPPADAEEMMLEHADGNRRIVQSYPRALRDASGCIVGGVNILIDVTSRSQLEEALWRSELRAAQAMAVAKLGTWRWIPSNGGVEADARCREICGLDPNAPTFSIEDIAPRVHIDDWQRVEAALKAVLRPGSGPYVEQFRFVHPDQTIHWVSSRGRTVIENGIPTLIGTVLDITESKTAEAALRDADRRKDEFLATLAHELRNPLVPLRAYLHVMRVSPQTPEQTTHMVGIMERQVDAMVRMVDDLLEVSRITRGTIDLHLETVDLADVLHSAIETSRPLIDAGRHRLGVQVEHGRWLLRADRVRLAQVFANLLNNASKYSPPQSAIDIVAQAEGDTVHVRVRDSGSGIAPDMLARVFDMFMQIGHVNNTAQGGLGIGLNLVRRLVELHGGSVQARSEGLGRGSEFSVCLPLANAASKPPDSDLAPLADH